VSLHVHGKNNFSLLSSNHHGVLWQEKFFCELGRGYFFDFIFEIITNSRACISDLLDIAVLTYCDGAFALSQPKTIVLFLLAEALSRELVSPIICVLARILFDV